MKKWTLFLLLMTLAMPGFAQLPKMYFSGGIANPSAPAAIADYWKSGMHYGTDAELGLPIPLPVANFKVLASVHYNNFAIDEDALLEMAGGTGMGIEVEGGATTVLGFSANLQYSLMPLSPIKPYLLGGAGIYTVSIAETKIKYEGEVVSTTSSASETKPGIALGAGADFNLLPQIDIRLEGRYEIVFTEDESLKFTVLRAAVSLF